MILYFLTDYLPKGYQMKRHMTESRMQGWRALAIGKDGSEHLVFVGMSYEQVKKNYSESFLDILTDEEQDNISIIQIQRWNGVPDNGKWVSQDTARIPTRNSIVNTQIVEEDEEDEEDHQIEPAEPVELQIV